ncbi:hypothetical protein ZWY2020_031841 [Hordeum vulgare]|nr:hypothetical protein ZWY2020_031841 [Hordeum vulgare]
MARSDRDPAARDGLEACGLLYGAGSVPAMRFVRGYAEARAWERTEAGAAVAHDAGRDRVRGGARRRAGGQGEDGRGQLRVRPAHQHGHRAAQQPGMTWEYSACPPPHRMQWTGRRARLLVSCQCIQ